MFKRYGTIEYFFSLSFKRGSKLLKKAVYEEKRDKTYAWWLARLPDYTKETYETFEEFYDKVYPPIVKIDTRSTDEIMAELLGKEE